jgi:hypothetical protein
MRLTESDVKALRDAVIEAARPPRHAYEDCSTSGMTTHAATPRTVTVSVSLPQPGDRQMGARAQRMAEDPLFGARLTP